MCVSMVHVSILFAPRIITPKKKLNLSIDVLSPDSSEFDLPS